MPIHLFDRMGHGKCKLKAQHQKMVSKFNKESGVGIDMARPG
jgi:hypothetical protein